MSAVHYNGLCTFTVQANLLLIRAHIANTPILHCNFWEFKRRNYLTHLGANQTFKLNAMILH